MLKKFLLVMVAAVFAVFAACDEGQPISDSGSCPNESCYSRAIECIPTAVNAPADDILVKNFVLRYDSGGKFESGIITVWRYNKTVLSEDFWTQGIIAVSADGSVTFEIEHEEIVLLSQYSPKEDRSLIPIKEIFAKIEESDIKIGSGSFVSGSAQYYLLTYGNEEQVAYMANSDSGVSYYDEFTETGKPSELSDENYVVNGRYCFILTSYSSKGADAQDWTVFMFDK